MSLKQGQAIFNGFPALTTIKRLTAVLLHIFSRFGTARRGAVNGRRIDVIADAMDHVHYLLQLRMIVNCNKLQFAVMVNMP